jgi:zinc transporter ZupT
MLGDAFIHQLPHAFAAAPAHAHSHAHSAWDSAWTALVQQAVGLSCLAGIGVFFLVERIILHFGGTSTRYALTEPTAHVCCRPLSFTVLGPHNTGWRPSLCRLGARSFTWPLSRCRSASAHGCEERQGRQAAVAYRRVGRLGPSAEVGQSTQEGRPSGRADAESCAFEGKRHAARRAIALAAQSIQQMLCLSECACACCVAGG